MNVRSVCVQSYRLVRNDVLVEIARRGINKIRVTGHSLGAAVATLCALDIGLGALKTAAKNAKKQFKRVEDAERMAADTYKEKGIPALELEHSANAARAALAKAALKRQANMTPEVALYTFGSPRVGNKQFKCLVHEKLPNRIFRAATATDLVTQILVPCLGFRHVGHKFLLLLTNGTIIPNATWIERRVFHEVTHSLNFRRLGWIGGQGVCRPC
jgi:hypothetical protein